MITGQRLSHPFTMGSQISPAVLMQWVLWEYLTAAKELKSISVSLPEDLQKMREVREGLALLSSAHRSDTLLFSLFTWRDGSLTKLKRGCVWLSSQPGKSPKIRHQACLLIENCLRCVDLFQEIPEDAARNFPLALKKVLFSLDELGRLLLLALEEFHRDENVLLFLIRHQKIFDHCFGQRFLTIWCEKIYPDGLEEIERFLIKRYSERGFSHLLAYISEKISEIKE